MRVFFFQSRLWRETWISTSRCSWKYV